MCVYCDFFLSMAESQSTLEAKLGALECHFTWDLDPSMSNCLRLRDKLEDIGSEEGYSWLGHIYNLQGYVHYQLGLTEDALRFFCKAAKALRQIRNTVSDEVPWLLVNYGNLAWLHHHLGEQAETHAHLSKINALLTEYPSPCQDELHPEICAEKGWTLMKFSSEKKLLAVRYLQKAIRWQPDMVEWHTSHVLALASAYKHGSAQMEADILEKMQIAKEHDAENLYLAALYLEICAHKGRKIEEEAWQLARRILRKPASSYSGIKPLLRLYQIYLSMDEAIDLAEEALERHPDDRYLKKRLAICYEERLLSQRDNSVEQSMVDRAIGLFKEVIALYPQSSLKNRLSLANIYGESKHSQDKAEQIFIKLLEGDQEPADRQLLYNYYAKYLHSVQKQSNKSIEYYMRAAAIQHHSHYRRESIGILERIKDRNRNRMCREIEFFLANLQD